MAASPDASLIAKVRAGDVEAFEGLVTRYKGLVFSTVCRILADRDSAADVVQDAFVKAFASIRGLNDPAAFRGWLLRIATNEALRHLRERKPELLADEGAAAGQQAPWSTPAGSVDETINKRMTARHIEHCIGKLPAIYRAALLMRFYGQLPYKDISEALGITLANVKFRIHHGSRLLRGLLTREELS
jgi:RNA polymerase sigma-70 factor (ECF subfamily)